MPARKSETITSWIIRFSATRVTQSITRIALPKHEQKFQQRIAEENGERKTREAFDLLPAEERDRWERVSDSRLSTEHPQHYAAMAKLPGMKRDWIHAKAVTLWQRETQPPTNWKGEQ
jgi:hypothetical protein